jgi:hypothetical protein
MGERERLAFGALGARSTLIEVVTPLDGLGATATSDCGMQDSDHATSVISTATALAPGRAAPNIEALTGRLGRFDLELFE